MAASALRDKMPVMWQRWSKEVLPSAMLLQQACHHQSSPAKLQRHHYLRPIISRQACSCCDLLTGPLCVRSNDWLEEEVVFGIYFLFCRPWPRQLSIYVCPMANAGSRMTAWDVMDIPQMWKRGNP